jgi:serine acetyltransferase
VTANRGGIPGDAPDDDPDQGKVVNPVTYRPGLRGDVARLLSPAGTIHGRPSLGRAIERALTRPGPMALALYRGSHALWRRGWQVPAEVIWRANVFLTGADIHPGAEIGGGLRITHTAGIVIGQGARIGSNVTILHGVTLGGSAKGWFDGVFEDGYPEVGDGTEIMAGAKVLGPIHVGRGCFIGANAVLARDLPDGEAYTPGRELSELRARLRELERRVEDLHARLSAVQSDGSESSPPAPFNTPGPER